ncbi:GNAT superfamily N-acetyltransferase [Deinococcus sp. HSC-46F16]|nr:GNAT superfamily N-acetyltransferase [Deinococcus sp. HSC-46F16]
MAEQEEAVVGYSSVARSPWHPEGWYQGDGLVLPSARGQGIGSALTGHAVA